jgi:hypothetical protein
MKNSAFILHQQRPSSFGHILAANNNRTSSIRQQVKLISIQHGTTSLPKANNKAQAQKRSKHADPPPNAYCLFRMKYFGMLSYHIIDLKEKLQQIL